MEIIQTIVLWVWHHIVLTPHTLTLHSFKPHNSEAIPLQPWTGPEGSRKLRLPDFKTIGT